MDNANTWGGRFYDNGEYVGHDEPDMTFNSNTPGSGDDVIWTEALGRDPVAAPTDANPGHDVSHWFELSPAPWFSMALCDPNSYPQLPCTPESDVNAPACSKAFNCPQDSYPGAGSAFMEMQFYPPGLPPFADSDSCDDSHWCAALTIDSLECTLGYAQCNPGCEEPQNFAFIQRGGVPAGPPDAQGPPPGSELLNTYTPNADTLLMNPGDKVRVHIFDAPAPALPGTPPKQKALMVMVDDLTTGQSGSMQASAYNGFATTLMIDCSGTPFNFEPEYSTAAKGNIGPWAALQTNISTEYETGHFEPCTSLSEPGLLTIIPGVTDTYYSSCAGPYEDAAPGGDGGTTPEIGDAFCYPDGDTHGWLGSDPDIMTGCQDDYFQNGDLDFDGAPYWAEWPTGPAPTASLPGSFKEAPPTSAGHRYSQFSFQTDLALSESTCNPSVTLKGCAVPPPNAPGHFYPYWSLVSQRRKLHR